MAKNNSTQSVEQIEPNEIHKPFSWLKDGVKDDQHAQFAAITKDICSGVETCLQLVHSDRMKRENEGAPLLSLGDAERLLMLAMQSARLLGETAEEIIDWKNNH